MTRLETLLQYQRRLGFFAGAKWSVARFANRRGFVRGSISIRPGWLRHSVMVRMQQSSDIDVFDAIFVRGELDFWRAFDDLPPRVILDLGANVGYASAAFLTSFPSAFLLAVEPDPINAEICRRNLAPYGDRAKVVQGAVWHRRGALVLSRGTFGDGREWSTEVRAALPGEKADVIAWDIPSLLKMCPRKQIDVLKIDIEGSECALFSAKVDEWLPHVRNICIEIHGPECEKAVSAALTPYRYKKDRTGEYALYLDVKR